MEIVIFAMTVTMGVAAARTSTIAERDATAPTAMRAVLSFASMLMSFSMLVWGFAELAWYWPISVFLIASIIAGVVISRSTWPVFFRVLPAIACAHVAGGIYLWTEYWPF